MNSRLRVIIVFVLTAIGAFYIAPQNLHAKPIARVSAFKGEVIVQSGANIINVSKTGHPLIQGDRIQTKQGEVQITFNDGALMKVRPFTSTMIQEREEKSGWWIFKTKKTVRRLTVFVGKLWFKSGSSKRKNYLQTPTAVCGLRGSESDFGFDPIRAVSLLNQYTGTSDLVGDFLKGAFRDPGATAALNSPVYKALELAVKAIAAAKTTKDIAQAKVAALQVVKESAKELSKNKDDLVKTEAEVANIAADASIAAAEAVVAVEGIKEAKAASEKAAEDAKAKGDMEAAALAEKVALDAEKALIDAEKSAVEAQKAADAAVDAATRLDKDAAMKAADEAQKAAEQAEGLGEKVDEQIDKLGLEGPPPEEPPPPPEELPPPPEELPPPPEELPPPPEELPPITTTPSPVTTIPHETTTIPHETTTIPQTTTTVPVTTTSAASS